MRRTRQLHDLGQRLWLDDITRTMLDDGVLANYIEADCVTGLTSNPSIFEKAIGESNVYDAVIAAGAAKGLSGESLFLELALDDLRRAAALFQPVFRKSGGVDGWVSMEVSPLLAAETAASIEAAARIHRQAGCDNLLVKIPGTPAGLPAIEESIFRGIPVNVTLLFSREQYVAAAAAYMRGIGRRLAAGLSPVVASVASLFVSRWDVAANPNLPAALHNRLGIAIAGRTYRAYVELLASSDWRRLALSGARPQRLLWASTGTKDPRASDTLYVSALAAPDTIDTMPQKTLQAFADHGEIPGQMPRDGGNCEAVLSEIEQAGLDVNGLALQLQREGTARFAKDWGALLESINTKAAVGTKANQRHAQAI
jgi:transaldolase